MAGRLAATAIGCAALALLSPLPGLAGQAAASTRLAGTVTINGPSVKLKVTKPGGVAKATFQGKSGQTVSEVLTGLNMTPNGCVSLALIEPGGATLDSGGGCNSGATIGLGPDTLQETGTYTVALTFPAGSTGSGTLWVSAPVTAGTVTMNGPSEPLKAPRYGQPVGLTFKGKSGQTVSEVLSGLNLSPTGCASVTLIEPGGATLDSGGGCNPGAVIGVGPDKLTATGTYTVRLTLPTVSTGSGTLWVSAPVTVGTVTVNGPSEPLKVTRYGQPVQRTFQGKAGEIVSEVLTRLNLTPNGCASIALIEPGGAMLDSGGGCNGGAVFGMGPDTLTATGTYTVQLNIPTTAKGGGKLLVSAPVVVGTSTVNGPNEPLKVTRYGQAVQRTFQGKRGQSVSVVLTELNLVPNGCATVVLLAPGGSELGSAGGCNGGATITVGPDKLAATGTYTVQLNIATNTKGGGQVRVST